MGCLCHHLNHFAKMWKGDSMPSETWKRGPMTFCWPYIQNQVGRMPITMYISMIEDFFFVALYRVLQKIKISKICSKGIFDVMHILLGRFRKIGIRFHRNTLGMGNCLDASKWQTWICKRRQGISLHGSCGRYECHRFTEVSKGAEHKLTIPLVAKETRGKWW